MHERLKASEVGQIECQTCEKKIYVVKKILGKIFLKFFSWNLILIYILNYFYHFQPFSYYKKCAYLKEVIRRDSDQCAQCTGGYCTGERSKTRFTTGGNICSDCKSGSMAGLKIECSGSKGNIFCSRSMIEMKTDS